MDEHVLGEVSTQTECLLANLTNKRLFTHMDLYVLVEGTMMGKCLIALFKN